MCEKRSLLGPLKFPCSQDQPVLGQEGLTVQGVSTQGSQYQKQYLETGIPQPSTNSAYSSVTSGICPCRQDPNLLVNLWLTSSSCQVALFLVPGPLDFILSGPLFPISDQGSSPAPQHKVYNPYHTLFLPRAGATL